MRVAELSRRPRLLSSNDSDRQRGVAMSITVSISAIQFHTPDVETDEKSNSRRSLSLILISVGADHPCCWKPHESLRSFSLTGTIFLSIPSHFARIQSSRSQYFTSTNHLSCGIISTFFTEGLLQRPLCPSYLRWLVQLPWRQTPRLLVMHVVFRFLKIFVYAAKRAGRSSKNRLPFWSWLAATARTPAPFMDPADRWRYTLQHSCWMVQGSSSWPLWVDATDLCCLRDMMMMMMMRSKRASCCSAIRPSY